MAKSVGNIALAARRRSTRSGRDALVMFFCQRPLPPADARSPTRRWPRPRRRVRRHPRGRRAGSCRRRRRPAELRRCAERFFAALADDFNTPQALAALCEWVREANRRDGASATRDLREMLGVLGARERCSTPATRRPAGRGVALLAEARAGRARGSATSPRPTRCATSSRARGWESCATRAGRLRAACPRVILYGRNPVREALRGGGAGRVHRVWATAGRGARSRGWRRRAGARRRRAEEIAAALRHATPTRASAPRPGPYPYADAEELLARRDGVADRALDEVQDPQNLGAICRTAECAGRDGARDLPSAARPRSRRRSARRRPARSSTCRVARVRNLADFLGEAKRGGLLVLRRRGRRARRSPYDAPDYDAARVVLVLGAEGRGLRPRVRRRPATQLVALPLRGQRRVAQRERRRRRRCCTRSCSAAGSA